MKYDKRVHHDSLFPGLYLMHSTHFLNFVRKLISYQYHILVHQLAYITMIVADALMPRSCHAISMLIDFNRSRKWTFYLTYTLHYCHYANNFQKRLGCYQPTSFLLWASAFSHRNNTMCHWPSHLHPRRHELFHLFHHILHSQKAVTFYQNCVRPHRVSPACG